MKSAFANPALPAETHLVSVKIMPVLCSRRHHDPIVGVTCGMMEIKGEKKIASCKRKDFISLVGGERNGISFRDLHL